MFSKVMFSAPARVASKKASSMFVRPFALSAIGEMNVPEVVKSRKNKMSVTYDGFQTFKDPVVLERAEGQYCYGPNGEK